MDSSEKLVMDQKIHILVFDIYQYTNIYEELKW